MKEKDIVLLGLGGLGSILALNLAKHGLSFTAFDADTVALHNLHRQILFRENHIGQKKAELAQELLHPYCRGVRESFSLDLLKDWKPRLIIEATDNGYLKLGLDQIVLESHQTLLIGSALGKEGFIWCRKPEAPQRLEHIFGPPNEEFLKLSCARSGVLGPLVNWVGGQMSQEVHNLNQPTDLPWKARFWRIQADPLSARCQDFS